MVIVAPIGDVLALVLREAGGDLAGTWLSGPRMTLILASAVVLAAAYYGYRNLEWRSSERHVHE